MAVVMDANGVTYTDGSVQTTKMDTSADTGALLSISAFRTAGAYTWTKPAGCKQVVVRLVGGGGGAAGYCESGGAGGYAEKTIDVSGIASVTVTVGGGGGNTGYYAAGGDGGTSSFGGYCSATGGYGANRNYGHTGGVGGSGSGGDVNLSGGSGTGHGNSLSSGSTSRGGDSYFGGAPGCNRNNGGGELGTAAPGTGGSGARTDGNWAGSTGRVGAVIVWEFK
jgi:hypothetical protein